MEKLYAKLWDSDGVYWQHKFATEEDAEACCAGIREAILVIDATERQFTGHDVEAGTDFEPALDLEERLSAMEDAGGEETPRP